MTRITYGPDGQSELDRHRELAVSGPLIDISIEAPNSAFAGVRAQGLIDTGASAVCIDRRTAIRLNLKQINETEIGVVGGGAVLASVHIGVLVVPALGFRQILPLYAVPMKQSSHSVLLGRSFLKNYIVTFDGPRGNFHFYNPRQDSEHALDDFAT